LIQAAPNFGQEILNQDDQLDRYASKVAENIKRVVQRVAEGEEPEPVSGSIATWNSTEENRQLIVHLVSTEDIRAIARHRNQFSAESLKVVMESLLTAISNPDNLLDNKLVFIDCLKEFADCFDKAIATDVFDVLAPIVSGNIELSVEIPCGAGQSHPLSRVNIIGATVEQVTARALFVLACIEHCRPGMYGKRLETIVEEALSSDSSVIRQSAFAAVREIPSLSESTWMPLLLGTRDPDPKAASLAFDAIATKRNAHLTRAQWKMVVYSLKMAQISRSIELRRGAARAVGSLEPQAPLSRSLRRELSAIREAFSNDIAHTVRVAANGGVEPVKMH
jgi:hypothetical protein